MELKEYHERFEDYRNNELPRLQRLYDLYPVKCSTQLLTFFL